MGEKERKAIKEMSVALRKIYGSRLSRIILYGSYARGVANPHRSDIDIMIVGKNFNNPAREIDRISRWLASISLKYDTLISVLPVSQNEYRKSKTPLMLNVRKEGVELWKK